MHRACLQTAWTGRAVGGLLLAGALVLGAVPAAPALSNDTLASDWMLGHKSRTRLTAARTLTGTPNPGQLVAFVEIALAEGWKTYWKSPGESGLPPRFDFAASSNVSSATVLYPAPMRIDDKGDVIIGYTGTVLFPVLLTPTDPKAPVTLSGLIQFGICKDICVPTEATLTLAIPPDAPGDLAAAEADSLARVPRGPGLTQPSDPRLTSAPTGLAPGSSTLTLTADFPGGSDGADAFLDVPDGLYLPPLTKTAENGTLVTFEAKLDDGVDRAALSGKSIGAVLVSKSGASETPFKFE